MIERKLDELQANYNGIADLCRQTGESVYITDEGVPSMVIMDINAFKEREAWLRQSNWATETLMEAELEFAETGKVYDVEELERHLNKR